MCWARQVRLLGMGSVWGCLQALLALAHAYALLQPGCAWPIFALNACHHCRLLQVLECQCRWRCAAAAGGRAWASCWRV